MNKTFDDAAKVKYPDAKQSDFKSWMEYISANGEQAQLRSAYIAGLEKCLPLVEAAKQLLHLHSCEQEGLLSGKPTSKMWFDAVNKLSEACKI